MPVTRTLLGRRHPIRRLRQEHPARPERTYQEHVEVIRLRLTDVIQRHERRAGRSR